MRLGLAGLGGLLLLVAALGCEKSRDASEARTGQEKPEILVDPMIFVELHQDAWREIIRTHWSDCEGGLAALLRHVAAHKEQFQKDFAGKPAGTRLPDSKGPRKITGLLMQWSKRCPEQIPRLNRTIEQLRF